MVATGSSSGRWGSGVARVMVAVRGVTVVVRLVPAMVAGMVCSNSDLSYLFKLNVCRLISHHSSMMHFRPFSYQ